MYWSQNYPITSIPENLKKNASAVIRNENTIIEINKVDDILYKNNSVISVLNKDALSLAIPRIYYEKGDVLSNIKVIIYDEKGEKLKSFSRGDFKDIAISSQGTFYSNSRLLYLPYTPTSYPFTVDFTYDQKDENTVFIPDFVPFNTFNVSLEKSNFKIINKSGINLRSKVYESPYQYTSVILGNEGDKSYSYQNVNALEGDVLVPDPQKILPKVSFSLDQFNLEGKKGNLTSWKDLGLWYYNDLLMPVSQSTPEIKAEIASLNLSGSVEEKVKKIYQYMQSKTRYVFIALGIGGWQPMLPDEVQKKGYGDCKGLTNYMKTLLDEAGIKSYYAIINSNSSSISFDKDFPKMAGNHVILVVPTEKGDIWLENTSQEFAFNHLSYNTTNRNVLLIKPSGIDIVETPSYSATQNKEKQVITVQINPDKSISGNGYFSYTGSQYDFNLGLISMSDKEKKDALKYNFSVLNFENLDATNFKNDRDNAQLSFDMSFKASNYAKNLGDSFILRAIPIYSLSFYHENENRLLPFETKFAFQDEYEITYKLPEGYTIEELPSDENFSSEFGEFAIKYEKKENQLLVKRVLTLKKGIYPKEKYNSYVTFRKKILNADNSKFLISKKS